MKITFLLTWGDEMGGTEQAVYTQAAHLAARHDVHVLSVFRTRPEPFFTVDERVTVRHLVDRTGPAPRPIRPAGAPAGTLGDAQCRRLAALPSTLIDPAWESTFDALSDVELGRELRTLATDVLVTTSPALLSAAADLAPADVVTVHQEHRPSQLRGATGEPLLVRAPELDALVVLTERTRDWLAESLGDAAPVLEAIPNAVPDGFRPRSGLTSKTIVMPRRLVPDKRVDHAVEAFARVLPDHPGWRLRIFGDGPEERRLREQIAELALHDSVELLGPSRNMTEEWARAAFTVLPSRDGEAFPLVLLEAFAAGVPAVAYDILTGPAEIIRPERDGLLVPSGDVEALAAAMGRLMGDPQLLAALGEEARSGAARFAPERITARWEELFARLAAERDTPARAARRADRTARRIASGGTAQFHAAAPVDRRPSSGGGQRERENALAAVPGSGLVRSGGRLAEVRDDLLPPDAAHRNFRTVCAALEDGQVPYLLLRDAAPRLRRRLAVDAADRDRALDALARHCAGSAVYAELLHPRTAAPAAVLAELLDGERAGDAAALRVFQPLTASSRTFGIGAAYGCDLEFWERQETTEDAPAPDGAAAPYACRTGPTALGPTLPTLTADAALTVRDREHPTLRSFTGRLVGDVTFPIDAVYTWVDDGDPAWQRRRAARRAALGLPPAASGDEDARFRNRDELRYSLRSLAMFAPWVRRVFLVTDDQVPDWLDTAHPDVRVVPHREIFDDPACLPTFNSHAIETRLHHVDGLAEHFLYLNDDIFLGRYCPPQTFFQSNGAPKFFPSPTAIPPGPATEDDEGYFAAAKNNRELLERRFGATVTHGFLHAPYALRRSLLERVERAFPEEVARTARNPLRGHRDVSLPSSLHHHFGYLSGEAVPGALRCSYVDTGDRSQHARLTRILTGRSQDVVCLGEAPDADVPPQEQEAVVRAFLAAYFPLPGPFEKGADGGDA